MSPAPPSAPAHLPAPSPSSELFPTERLATLTDGELIALHRDGHPAAFAALFDRYQGSLFNVVHRMVRGEDAYDLTQDVFLKALRALPTFRGDSKFSTWLFTIARHTCLNYLRHKGVVTEESLEARWEENESTVPVSRNPSVERTVELRELEDIVGSVLAKMPADARLLLVLRDFEQLSYEEISQITELSIVNVKSRLHRARQLFKRKFAPWMDWLPEGTQS